MSSYPRLDLSDDASAERPDARGPQRPPEPLAIRLQRRVWDRRAGRWDHAGSPDLTRVVDTVLAACSLSGGEQIVDLGCGTGALSLPLAARTSSVLAVDVSEEMLRTLRSKAVDAGLANLTTRHCPIERLDLGAASVDRVVSNYALHHLRDGDKQAVIAAAAGWLRPGGLLVVGDMMFGRGASAGDRAIIRSKVASLARRGPGGWWRVAKNVVRYTLRVQERPVSSQTWARYAERAGLVDVRVLPVVAEAAVVVARKAS